MIRNSNSSVVSSCVIATVAILAVMTILSSGSRAADPGEAGYLFLTVGTDARAEAMGGAHTGVADGLGGSYYNPASLADAQPGAVVASYTNWVTDIQSGFIAGAMKAGTTARLALGIQYLDYGDFLGFDGAGVSSGNFGASDFAVVLGVAGTFSEQFAWGLSGRFITESIAAESSTGFGFDAGARYTLGDRRTRLGVAIRNLGAQTSALGGGSKDDLPITGSLGISHKLQGAPLLVAADVLKPMDDDFGAAGGLEFSGLDPLSLRAGYNTLSGAIETGSSKDDLAGFTFGAGFILNRLQIDYSYGSLSELGDTHRFTLRTAI